MVQEKSGQSSHSVMTRNLNRAFFSQSVTFLPCVTKAHLCISVQDAVLVALFSNVGGSLFTLD